MNTTNSPNGLGSKDFTDQRNDALREGVKGLLLINGGGATAMLAFLQAVWPIKPQVVTYVVICVGFLALGLFLAGLVQFFRYHASFSIQGGHQATFKRYRFLYLAAAYGSLVAFLLGVSVMVVGVLYTL